MSAGTWAPVAPLPALELRASVYRALRDFLVRRGVLEVETPILSRAANPDPNIHPLQLQGPTGRWYLRSSPEFPLKRLLAAGSGAVFELGKVFRAGEQGRWHSQEFTMLEWYRPGFDEHQLAREAIALVEACCEAAGRAAPEVVWWSAEALLRRVLPELEGFASSTAALLAAIRDRGWFQGGLERAEALELLVSEAAREAGAPDRLLVIHGFPPECRALARVEEGRARRVELYLGPLELANGYHELQDAGELARRFAADNDRRAAAGLREVDVDAHLLAAQRHGLPCCAGMALGVDRLLAWLDHGRELASILAFPADRA